MRPTGIIHNTAGLGCAVATAAVTRERIGITSNSPRDAAEPTAVLSSLDRCTARMAIRPPPARAVIMAGRATEKGSAGKYVANEYPSGRVMAKTR